MNEIIHAQDIGNSQESLADNINIIDFKKLLHFIMANTSRVFHMCQAPF